MAKDTKRRSPRREPKYRRLTLENRITIRALRKEGFSTRHIADRIGCSPSTASRELGRNVSKKGYRPKKADAKARRRASAKAGKRRKFTSEMWDVAVGNLRKGWTFEQTAEARARVGNWEGDLINGNHGTGNLVTLVERMTRFTLVAYSATKEADAVAAVIIGVLAGLPRDMLRTLTFDNGKEFAKFAQLEQALGLKVYFAKPYHSWERGTNENRNGVVRKVLPKGNDFDKILEEEMRRIDYLLNDRPLRCLNWRTPREAFQAILMRHLFAA